MRALVAPLPEADEQAAWTGRRWRVRGKTFVHLFGGEDQLLRVTMRAEMSEVAAFEHSGPPYFRVGGNSVGLVVDESTDLTELAELITDSYCLRAPAELAAQVRRPGPAD